MSNTTTAAEATAADIARVALRREARVTAAYAVRRPSMRTAGRDLRSLLALEAEANSKSWSASTADSLFYWTGVQKSALAEIRSLLGNVSGLIEMQVA